MDDKKNWLARRRAKQSLRREQTGDTPEKRAERPRPDTPPSSTEAMAKTGTIGFLTGGF